MHAGIVSKILKLVLEFSLSALSEVALPTPICPCMLDLQSVAQFCFVLS